MLKKFTASCLSCLFLLGSVILPLGDFSLMGNLHGMYKTYEKLAAPDEKGIADFIGDYIFAGKDLLGHNKSDKSAGTGNAVQFQQASMSFSVVNSTLQLSFATVTVLQIQHVTTTIPATTTEYHPELFRPPLA